MKIDFDKDKNYQELLADIIKLIGTFKGVSPKKQVGKKRVRKTKGS